VTSRPVLDRDKLYAEIWAAPAVVVAERYGITSTALAKICRKLGVPVPGRGYWVKKSFGRKLPRPPLPSSVSSPQTYRISPTHHRPKIHRTPEGDSLLERERKQEWSISVAPTLSRPHRLLETSLPALRKAAFVGRPPARPRHFLREAAVLDISVSRSVLPRAFCIFDALLKAAEKRGYSVAISKRHARDSFETFISIFEQQVAIRIRERLDLSGNPQGRLEILLADRYPFKEQDSEPLETRLNEVFAKAVVIAEEYLAQDLVRRQTENLRREQESRAVAQRKLLEAEEARVRDIRERLACMREAREIRELVSLMKAHGTTSEAWETWAMERAGKIEQRALESVSSAVETNPGGEDKA
jgi:hypothetical protein